LVADLERPYVLMLGWANIGTINHAG
jgi:hypothetical protein